MAEKRLNSEKKIEAKNVRLKIGTTNKNEPKVIYIEGRAFICPLDNKEDYSDDISSIKYDFKHAISNNLINNYIFENKFIVDFQVASKGISYNKKSFLSFQFLLKQKSDKPQKLKEIKTNALPLITNIVNDLTDSIEEHNFAITKSKS